MPAAFFRLMAGFQESKVERRCEAVERRGPAYRLDFTAKHHGLRIYTESALKT